MLLQSDPPDNVAERQIWTGVVGKPIKADSDLILEMLIVILIPEMMNGHSGNFSAFLSSAEPSESVILAYSAYSYYQCGH